MLLINTSKSLQAVAHYSPATRHQDLIFISGQLPIDPNTGMQEHGTIEAQTLRVLKNIELILLAAGSGVDHVLKTTIFVSDISSWDQVNQVYASFFGTHRPARSVVPTGPLHFGFKIEMEAIAEINDTSQADGSVTKKL